MSAAAIAIFVVPARLAGTELVLPLDDVYIHFQYATGIAAGDFYVYNDGLPPSSGATSLLYPYLLAFGRLLGLRGLSLGWWALALGYTALVASSVAVVRLVLLGGLGRFGAGLMALVFAGTGAVGWHYSSGMETGLLIAFMLWTLVGLVERRLWLTVLCATLMAITRPEGAIMAVVVTSVVVLFWWRSIGYLALWGVLPAAALGLQPLVNLLATGSSTAAGSSAKSILSAVPPDIEAQAWQILSNFGRMWWELFTGWSAREGLYLPVGLLALALVGAGLYVWRSWSWPLGLVLLGWLLGVTAAVSTLDPAFWHFKRYQMPVMALLFPLAGWTLAHFSPRWRVGAFAMLVGSAAVSLTVYFAPAYSLNVGYLRAQQIPMAQWLRDNTQEDAVVAVHDVGLMRYLGERTTIDMVGLTTRGAAESWRNGPGALAEFLTRYAPRPDYVASYTDALGLSYLADTGLYGELLVDFPVEPSARYNVALAGAYQGVWRVDWSNVAAAATVGSQYYADYVDGARLVAEIDVGDLTSEAAYEYTWRNDQRLPGFPTEVYEMSYPDGRRVLDGGRLINGEEQFTVPSQVGEDMVLITRLHPRMMGTFDVAVADSVVASRAVAAIPGNWVDVATVIPANLVDGPTTEIAILPNVPGGHYMPYFHWVYQGDFPDVEVLPEDALAQFDGFALHGVEIVVADGVLSARLDWVKDNSQTLGDYRLFVHVYDDLNSPPAAQLDRYPLGQGIPPGNWLPGELSDTIVVTLESLPDGVFTVAVGLYDPTTGERLVPRAGVAETTGDGRLLIGEIEVR
ncbi:MAG: hypothetical protein AAF125_00530 [Chloroflexota bacterium]